MTIRKAPRSPRRHRPVIKDGAGLQKAKQLQKSEAPQKAEAPATPEVQPSAIPSSKAAEFEAKAGSISVADLPGTIQKAGDGHGPRQVAQSPLFTMMNNIDPAAGQKNRGVPAFGSVAFERQLDKDTNSVARTGNTVKMLFDGVESFAERDKIIDAAQDSIHLQTFIFTADDTGWDLAKRLVKKAKEGVDVRVIYDELGSNRSGDEIFDFMRKGGVEVRGYGDPLGQFWDINDRWHEKHLIVDGQVSIEGGMNIADEYALGGSGRQIFRSGAKQGTEPWRDADMRIEGPAVHDAQRGFMRNWAELGDPIPADQHDGLFSDAQETGRGPTVRFVQHRPDEDGDDNTTNLYLSSINAAQKSIHIENAYFLPPKEMRDALVAAAQRGVDVQVMTNSRASNDMGFVSDAARYFMDELVDAGVKVYEKQGGTLHSKTATFDGEYSLVGSHNLNGRSDTQDSESMMATNDPGIAARLEARFESGIAETQEVTKSVLENEGFITNAKQWALSLFAWTF